ncbi:SLBB domain-containing protein, partial [Mitsuokella multacida]|uniref:SLBB domain-containing protein n=1 Tax=Mitsuokella multacida TaxID=52226 RepID=UPI003F809661
MSVIYLSKEAIVLPMYRKSLLILLLILIAVAGGTYYGCYMQEKESVQLDVAANPAVQQGGTEKGAEITVYVTGAINKPGVVTVKEGARTADAVNACGGLLPTADAEEVNMAAVLKDG